MNNKFQRVYVEKIDCTSCSKCASLYPEYFRLDKDGFSETHNNGENINDAIVLESDWNKIEEAMNECPGECIHWK